MNATDLLSGYLRKMSHCIEENNEVSYYLRLVGQDHAKKESSQAKSDETNQKLNDFLGKKIKLEFSGEISCIGCGREIKKTFNQGYCFPCLQNLAECDTCIIKPELCHFDEGSCRDSEWGEKHCNIPHSIYLSLTSGVKIGITRQHQEKTRWVDQGAVEALRIATVDRRKTAGLVEVEIAKDVADKTNWRNMLKNEINEADLKEMREEIFENYEEILCEFMEEDAYKNSDMDESLVLEEKTKVQKIKYPVLKYPEKVKSHNFDKNPVVEGSLEGIKGQYLILDTGVINLRKFAGYKVSFEA